MHSTAISAIDCALWIFWRKVAGYRCISFWEGRPERGFPCIATVQQGQPGRVCKNMKLCRKRGYLAAKTTLPLFYGSPISEDKTSSNGYSGTGGVIDRGIAKTEIPGCIDLETDR